VWDIDEPAELAYSIGANPCVEVVKAGVRRALPQGKTARMSAPPR